MHVSLPLRINLISLGFAVVVATVLTVVGGVFLHQQQLRGAIVLAQLASDELASRAERLLALQLDLQDLLDFDKQCADVIRGDPQLREAAVYNAQGVQQYHSSGQPLPWPATEKRPEPGGSLFVDAPGGGFVLKPIVQGSERIVGYAVVAIDESAVLEATLRPIGWLVLSSLVLFVTGLVIQQRFFWRAVGRPLAGLVRTADQISPDDPQQIAQLQRHTAQDDIGRVYGALARLLARLHDARNELVTQNIRLEATVRERTVQLEQANRDLASDIERRKELEAELRTRASTDELTGLANRAFILPYVERRLEQARRQQTLLGVAILDFDGFKAINDTYGHGVGDQTLRIMGRRMQEVCRQSDVIARLGGDEFLIGFEGFTDDGQVEALCERITQLFGQSMQVCGHEVHVGASIGVALFPSHGNDLSSLIAAADRAMYDAKMAGGGYRFASVPH